MPELAMAMLLTMRGTPFIYYGEEIGMRNISLSRKEIMDPVGKILLADHQRPRRLPRAHAVE